MIKEKSEFLRLWITGCLGNRLRVFNSLKELEESNYRGPLGIRSRNPDNRNTLYGIKYENLGYSIRELIFNRYMTLEEMYFGEAAPDEHLVLQGEYFDGEAAGQIYDRYLMIDRQKTQMKKVLWNQRSETYTGLQSLMVLKGAMDPNSWSDFQTIVELYPNHIIEFTVYSVFLGHLPHRNTLIWEVRQY